MILCDVNVLIHAFRKDSAGHPQYREWLEKRVNSAEPYGLSELVASGFIRIVTHPGIFRHPSSLEEALTFLEILRSAPNCVLVAPGPGHWELFVGLCSKAGIRGNLVPDAYLAALAMDSGCEWITLDRDYARFPGLRWRHPLD
jgi:uncharacterized protein